MMNFSLDGVMTAVQFVRQHAAIAMTVAGNGNGNQQLEPKYKEVVENNLQWVHKMCGQHLLSAAEDRVVRIWNIWLDPICYGTLALELKPLLEALEDDLRKLRFYRYPQHKAMEFLRIPATWDATLKPKAFPSVRPEIEAGVDCYALEHNTACVFYMMRVAEIGMRSLARERQVSFAKYPIEWAEWENVIDQIEAKARASTVGMGRGPVRDAIRSFYTTAVAHLRALKESRNRVMHTRGPSLDELDAQRAMSQVRDFMNGLSVKIGEKTRRPIPLSRWP